MKKLALLALLALEFAVCGCGTSGAPSNTTNTQATGNWEAQLTGGTDQASLLNFVTTFTVTNSGPLSVTGFGFFNAGSCFTTGTNAETVSGNATFTTSSTNTVTGTLTLTVTSTTNGSVFDIRHAYRCNPDRNLQRHDYHDRDAQQRDRRGSVVPVTRQQRYRLQFG